MKRITFISASVLLIGSVLAWRLLPARPPLAINLLSLESDGASETSKVRLRLENRSGNQITIRTNKDGSLPVRLKYASPDGGAVQANGTSQLAAQLFDSPIRYQRLGPRSNVVLEITIPNGSPPFTCEVRYSLPTSEGVDWFGWIPSWLTSNEWKKRHEDSRRQRRLEEMFAEMKHPQFVESAMIRLQGTNRSMPAIAK